MNLGESRKKKLLGTGIHVDKAERQENGKLLLGAAYKSLIGVDVKGMGRPSVAVADVRRLNANLRNINLAEARRHE